MSASLHDRLRAAVEEKLALAQAATVANVNGQWGVKAANSAEDVAAMVAFWHDRTDPAAAVRQHEAALRVLERHAPTWSTRKGGVDIQVCAHAWADGDGWLAFWPCQDAMDVADAYGVPVDTVEEGRG